MKYIILICLVSIVFGQKTYQTSYETSMDFTGFYVENGNDYASTMDTTIELVKHGVWSHKHWVDSARDVQNDTGDYEPHRAYVTHQFYKHAVQFFNKCLVSIYIYTDVNLYKKTGTDDWLSLATFSDDTTNSWDRTVLVNLTTDGYIRLVHVPIQQGQTHTYQAGPRNTENPNLKWPQREWNRLDVYLDFDSTGGEAKVWQNGSLISTAEIDSVNGYIVQAHFGLYSSATMASGTVYNDKLRIIEVANDSVAQVLVDGPW